MPGVAVHGHLGGEQVVDEAQLVITRLLRKNVQSRPGPRTLVVRAERERLGVSTVFPQEVEQCAPVPSHALEERSQSGRSCRVVKLLDPPSRLEDNLTGFVVRLMRGEVEQGLVLTAHTEPDQFGLLLQEGEGGFELAEVIRAVSKYHGEFTGRVHRSSH